METETLDRMIDNAAAEEVEFFLVVGQGRGALRFGPYTALAAKKYMAWAEVHSVPMACIADCGRAPMAGLIESIFGTAEDRRAAKAKRNSAVIDAHACMITASGVLEACLRSTERQRRESTPDWCERLAETRAAAEQNVRILRGEETPAAADADQARDTPGAALFREWLMQYIPPWLRSHAIGEWHAKRDGVTRSMTPEERKQAEQIAYNILTVAVMLRDGVPLPPLSEVKNG